MPSDDVTPNVAQKMCWFAREIGPIPATVSVNGPQLNGVVGRKAGTVEGYKYSKAMKNSGLTWDEATLDKFLIKPKNEVKGTKMIFGGLKKEKQRANLICYLKTFGADGKQAE